MNNKNTSRNLRVALIAINARYSHTNLAVRLLRQACAVTDKNYDLIIAEYTINEQPRSILQKLNELDCDVYAFSCYIWNRDLVVQLCQELKQIRTDCTIIAGGPEVSWQPESVLEQVRGIDLVISGEGETVLPLLLSDISVGMTLGEASSRHNNLACLNEDGTFISGGYVSSAKTEDWPFAYTENELNDLAGRILYYESSRGCPFGCTYCLSSRERTVRFRPMETVCHELEILIDSDVSLVKFVDRTFNCNAERARQIWRWLLERYDRKAYKTRFHFEVTAELLEDECIELLQQVPHDLFQFEIGVQSTQPDVLKYINRPCNIDLLSRRVGQLRSAGNIHIHLDLIAGLPGETLDMFRSSFDSVAGMRPDMLQLGFLKVLPGSLMHAQAIDKEMSWQSRPPYEVLHSDVMSFNDLSVLKRMENLVDIYYNSGQFRLSIGWILKHESSAYDFFLEMSELYKANGWENRQIGRNDKWIFLLEFCELKLNRNDLSLFRDLLVLDFIFIGQKDRPDWQSALENSINPADLKLLSEGKEAVRLHYPDCRRYRLERFCIEPAKLYSDCRNVNLNNVEDSSTASCEIMNPDKIWLAAFDFNSIPPILFWQRQIKS